MFSRTVNRKKVLSRLVDSLRKYEPEKLYLYGSWARGEEDEMSDIDIVVVKDTKEPFLERLVEASRFLAGLDKSVDLLIYTPEELARMEAQGNAFIEMLLEEGKLIYAKESS
jgi:predicted nucleotidyltransferase